jgi:hypothetical protein
VCGPFLLINVHPGWWVVGGLHAFAKSDWLNIWQVGFHSKSHNYCSNKFLSMPLRDNGAA